MRRDKYKVWIEAEEWAEGEWNIHNDNTDVIVEFDIWDRWRASFYTYSNINKLIENNQNTGECLCGKSSISPLFVSSNPVSSYNL